MNKFIKKLFGIDKLEEEIVNALEAKNSANKEAQEAQARLETTKEAERLSKLSEKDLATEKKEPYFKIVSFQSNKENPRFGFWELDWNEYKIAELKSWGYTGETDEDIINQWFTEVCRDSGQAVGLTMDRRATGFINVQQIGDGRTEVS